MADRTVTDCDRCKVEIPQKAVMRVVLVTDTMMDGAGSRDYETKSADLCPACVQKGLMSILLLVPTYAFDRNQAMIKFLLGDQAQLKKALPCAIEGN